ncbi:phage tail protein [Enterobacter asburiae]|nr:phage tail protein [Enterobacter asburiae]
MADSNLSNPVVIQATRLDASVLPKDLFSQSYILYIIANGTDVGNVANKANEAGQGAYDAQLRNDQQDSELADHESRIAQLRFDVNSHEVRITANTAAISALTVRVTTAEGNITSLQASVSSLTTRVTTAETSIANLQTDYVSKSSTAAQTLASPLNVATSYSIGGTKVVGARVTGFSAMTGTARKTTLNADYSETGSATYSSAQMTQIFDLVKEARQKLKAHDDAMRTHGLID